MLLPFLLARVAYAQRSPPPARGPLDPVHRLAFSNAEVHSAAFTPDGRVVYVHLHAPLIDLWPVLVSWWPEALAVVCGLLTLWLAARLWRVRARPQERGKPYCRRCNYDVSSHVKRQPGSHRWIIPSDDARCPECGARLSRRRGLRAGRGLVRRTVFVSSLWLLSVTAMIVGLCYGLPRQGSVSRWRSWPSMWAANLAIEHQIAWLLQHVRDGDAVVEVDLQRGGQQRTVLVRTRKSYEPIVIAPDGRSMFVTRQGHVIDRYQLPSGKLIEWMQMPGRVTVDVGSPAVIGFSSDGDSAYVQWASDTSALSGVSEWNLGAESAREVVTVPAHVDSRSGRNHVVGRLFVLRSGAEAPSFISYPQFMEAFPSQTFVLQYLYSAKSDEPRVVDLKASISPNCMPAMTPDGASLFLPDRHGRMLLRFDVEQGKVAERIGPPPGQFLVGTDIVLSPDGRWMLTGRGAEGLLLRDAQVGKWIRLLRSPKELYGHQPLISPDARWAGAVAQKNLGPNALKPTGFTHELLIWDISVNTREAADASSAPASAN
jgi:hypothetical protein